MGQVQSVKSDSFRVEFCRSVVMRLHLLLHHFKPQFPNLLSEDNKNIYFIGLLGGSDT